MAAKQNPKLVAIKKKKQEIDRAYRALVGGTGGVRESQRALMAERRRSERGVQVPPCEDRERRVRLEPRSLEADVAWLMWYFAPESGTASPFTYEFTGQQCEMIEAIRAAIVDGGDQALAALRGREKPPCLNACS